MDTSENADYRKYFIESGESGFSPARNKQIVTNSIKKYEAKRAQNAKSYAEQVAERIDAVSHYLRSRVAMGTPLEKYFSRKELAHLRGQKIMEEIRGNMRVLSSLD